MQQHAPSRPAGSKKPLAIIAGLVVVGGVIAIVAIAAGGKKNPGGDRIDLENEQLQMVRDQACECKDEACLREAIGQLDHIQKLAEESGLKGTDEQHALGKKTFDEIGVCISKVSKGASSTTSAGGGDIVSEMGVLRDAMCACKDLACAKSLQPRFDQWRDKYMPTFKSLPADVKSQTLEATRAQKKCFEQLSAAAPH